MPSSLVFRFSALAVDYHEGNVTFHELTNHWIYMAPDITSESDYSIPAIEAGTSGRVNGLAIDWLANNVYWVDEGYNWIKMTNYNGEGEVTIADMGFEKPSGIACHPHKDFLFWTELGDQYPPKIERSTMAGNNRITIVDGLTEPRSVAVDTILDRIYWTDNTAAEIKVESSDLDGNGRRIEVSEPKSLGVFDSIAVDETYIFVSGSSSEDFMRYYRKVSPNLLVFEYEFGSEIELYDLCVAGPNIQSQPVTSPCDGNTCEHYCVSAANNNHECLCRDDYVINPNGTCSIDKSIYYPPYCVIGQTDAISSFDPTILHHDWLSFHGVDAYIHNLFSGSPPYGTTALVVDTHSNLLFLADDLGKEIFVVKVKGGEFSVSIHKYNTGQIEGMAVDWLTLTLYYVDYVTESRGSMKYDGNDLTTKYDVTKPTAIAVDPFARYMFWTEETSPAKVVRSDLDFTNRRDLADIGLQKPTGMTIDLKLNRIYMVGSDSRLIYSTDYDGNNKQTIGTSKYAAIDITSYQDFLILAEPLGIFSGMVEAIHKPTGEHEGSIMLDSFVSAIAIADESTQPRTSPLTIQDDESENSGLNIGAVVGGLIAVIILIVIVIVIYKFGSKGIYSFRFKRSKENRRELTENDEHDNNVFIGDTNRPAAARPAASPANIKPPQQPITNVEIRETTVVFIAGGIARPSNIP
ncbi:low-density lipoprotein receptor-related protein-like [Antedon mediterranea]|uniref:low-density lipoprotein receptor-related protein-like n=1 Tax=Antedon mediterranea TaxID=105859 RepID=UPI003AF4B72A